MARTTTIWIRIQMGEQCHQHIVNQRDRSSLSTSLSFLSPPVAGKHTPRRHILFPLNKKQMGERQIPPRFGAFTLEQNGFKGVHKPEIWTATPTKRMIFPEENRSIHPQSPRYAPKQKKRKTRPVVFFILARFPSWHGSIVLIFYVPHLVLLFLAFLFTNL